MRRFTQCFWAALSLSLTFAVQANERARLEALVDDTVAPLMAEHHVPGMAVALSVGGERYLFTYGMADLEAGRAVGDDTLFELGSLSKLYTATLAAYADTTSALTLTEPASRYLSELEGSAFDAISLLELATYTAGGLPLQFPDVVDDAAMLDYFREWRPAYAPGTRRLYSNPSIGLLGYITAHRLGQPFEKAMAEHVFSPLNLAHSFYDVPAEEQINYAYGYSADNAPIRVNPGVLDAQAYGLKATAADVLTFIEAHLESTALTPALQEALRTTRTGYFTLNDLTQGLGWERYATPATLAQLETGNSMAVVLEANAVELATPALSPESPAWFNKTGATNGFGNYVAFVPEKQIGIVLLANRNYPNQARIEAAYRLIDAITETPR
ncbi:class C beta-lactamase [Vreelandella sp. EE7]